VKGVNCEKMGGTIYSLYDVLLRRELPFGVMMTAPVLKCLVALILKNCD